MNSEPNLRECTIEKLQDGPASLCWQSWLIFFVWWGMGTVFFFKVPGGIKADIDAEERVLEIVNACKAKTQHPARHHAAGQQAANALGWHRFVRCQPRAFRVFGPLARAANMQ